MSDKYHKNAEGNNVFDIASKFKIKNVQKYLIQLQKSMEKEQKQSSISRPLDSQQQSSPGKSSAQKQVNSTHSREGSFEEAVRKQQREQVEPFQ